MRGKRPCYMHCLGACGEMPQIAQRKNRTLADGDGDLPRSRLCLGTLLCSRLRESSSPSFQKPTQAVVDELEDKRRRSSLGRHRSIAAHKSRSRATERDTCISTLGSFRGHGCRIGTAYFEMQFCERSHVQRTQMLLLARLLKHPLSSALGL